MYRPFNLESAILQAIALSQMDTYRKELLRASRDRVDEVLFSKVSAGQGVQGGAVPFGMAILINQCHRLLRT